MRTESSGKVHNEEKTIFRRKKRKKERKKNPRECRHTWKTLAEPKKSGPLKTYSVILLPEPFGSLDFSKMTYNRNYKIKNKIKNNDQSHNFFFSHTVNYQFWLSFWQRPIVWRIPKRNTTTQRPHQRRQPLQDC
jgi:hypothetical protein